MPEIGTSGSMSEDGKRSDWQSLKHRAFPRLYTTGRGYGFRARHLAVAPRNDVAHMIGFMESIY